MGLVCVYVLVQFLVAHCQGARNPFRAPLHLQKRYGLILQPRCYQRSVAAACTLLRQLASLLGAVALTARIAAQVRADRGLAAAQQIRNLCDVVCGFHKAVNLISFDLA